MAILPAVYPLLANAAPVTALIGTNPVRCYRHGRAPQGVSVPYVTWASPASSPERQITGVPVADRWNVRIDCWSDNDTEVETLAQVVRDAIEPFAESIGVVIDDRDDHTNRYRITQSFDFWLLR